jgi:hypothetical protein
MDFVDLWLATEIAADLIPPFANRAHGRPLLQHGELRGSI